MTWVKTSQQRFYLHDNENLLDGLLRTGHDVAYQCKEGYCGSCRTQVIEHTHPIEYEQEPLAMVEANEILPCCCQIKGHIKLAI